MGHYSIVQLLPLDLQKHLHTLYLPGMSFISCMLVIKRFFVIFSGCLIMFLVLCQVCDSVTVRVLLL